jgi:hypothetical protein
LELDNAPSLDSKLETRNLKLETRSHSVAMLPSNGRPAKGDYDMYRFGFGRLKGMTMEHAMLTRTPRLHEIAAWAQEKVDTQPNLGPLVSEFRLLKKLLNRAKVKKRCGQTGCEKRARWMTFPVLMNRGFVMRPYLWCDRHGPTDYSGISQKVSIEFDSMDMFSTRGEKKTFCREVIAAWGVPKGTRITESFARRFFMALLNR